ncbi:hypothetical protein BC827DRAFT_1385402 [Russula dissimulans]|nr:hypothetical protein BC827DRAFT_1385402 [Russula dissimulans]
MEEPQQQAKFTGLLVCSTRVLARGQLMVREQVRCIPFCKRHWQRQHEASLSAVRRPLCPSEQYDRWCITYYYLYRAACWIEIQVWNDVMMSEMDKLQAAEPLPSGDRVTVDYRGDRLRWKIRSKIGCDGVTRLRHTPLRIGFESRGRETAGPGRGHAVR